MGVKITRVTGGEYWSHSIKSMLAGTRRADGAERRNFQISRLLKVMIVGDEIRTVLRAGSLLAGIATAAAAILQQCWRRSSSRSSSSSTRFDSSGDKGIGADQRNTLLPL